LPVCHEKIFQLIKANLEGSQGPKSLFLEKKIAGSTLKDARGLIVDGVEIL
jgi:hypothetical protein